ncbi:MAG: DNA polymerase domain-containing protein [Candidatus Thorarchaeota archaeon]
MPAAKKRGWLLDVSLDDEKGDLILWIRDETGTKGLRYRRFRPSLFVKTDLIDRPEFPVRELIRRVSEHPRVLGVRLVKRYLSVYDEHRSKVLQVFVRGNSLQRVAEDLETLPGAIVFHADLDAVQQFFIDREIFPFSLIEYETDGIELFDIRCLSRREEVEYEVPPLREIQIEPYMETRGPFPRIEDPIHHIRVRFDNRTLYVRGHSERETLCLFQEVIDRIDPDIIITRGGDDGVLRYLSMRYRVNNMALRLSRDGRPLIINEREPSSFWQYNRIVFRPGNQVMLRGRIHIDMADSLYYAPSRVEGVIEGCRLAMAPPQRVARMSIGSVNAAMQYYTAMKREILIPPVKRNPEYLKTVERLLNLDRGGLILQPRPDIYENVGEFDFSSMYPTIMITKNISPETVCTRTTCPYDKKYCIDVPELDYKICGRKRGLVPESLELVVKKRNQLKRLMLDGKDVRRHGVIQNTLKGILVSCFGYLGFRNARFGRVEAHAAVTAFARDILLRTQEIAEERGLELVHGIVDSLWVHSRTELGHQDLLEFARQVTECVGIEMTLKGVYRWMVVPSSRLHPVVAPMNRYYGVYRNGSIKVRGIEARRRDTCLYVRDCQKEMIRTLAHAPDRDALIRAIPDARAVCEEFIRKLREGDVDIRDLVLQSRLTHHPDEYHGTTRVAVAARQLAGMGRRLYPGQSVRYIMVESKSRNPARRVRAIELVDESTRYDPDAYSELCIRAFENLIPAQYLDSSSELAHSETRLT